MHCNSAYRFRLTRFFLPVGHAIRRRALAPGCAAIVLGCLAWGRVAQAGGGPENLLLVVNSRSWASMSVANVYIALRKVPPANVLHLDWAGSTEETDIETFREKLLRPALAAIRERGLQGQIDYVVWSSDFPFAVDAAADIEERLPKYFGSVCSLTSLTYLGRLADVGNPNVVSPAANAYYRRSPDDDLHNAPPSRGYRSRYIWADEASKEAVVPGGYWLSTMLAFTSGNGNSVAEAADYLTRAAQADGTHPAGTFYFVGNTGVRSTTRDRYFAAAVESLRGLGLDAEEIEGTLPLGKPDVQGAMIGHGNFNWRESHSRISPGAICEHLTSFGGNLVEGAGQTPLTEFLRYGAAGASGAVREPYTFQQKFPTAWMHLHYARGCSLAEAFYQSVAWPYQLLIVGDPLCQPYANIPQVDLKVPPPTATWSGKIDIEPVVKPAGERAVSRWEWFIDGVWRKNRAVGEKIELDTRSLADGAHELRIVAIEDGPIESQGRRAVPFVCGNGGREIALQPPANGAEVRWGEPLVLRVTAPGAERARLFHCRRQVAETALQDAAGIFVVDPRDLGTGPVSLWAAAYREGEQEGIASAPVEVAVSADAPLPGQAQDDGTFVPGLQLTLGDGSHMTIERTQGTWLQDAGVGAADAYSLAAAFDLPADDVYQFQCRHVGKLRLTVDGREVYATDAGKNEVVYAPVSLGAGRHTLEVTGGEPGEGPVDLRFGSRGVRSLHSALFFHAE